MDAQKRAAGSLPLLIGIAFFVMGMAIHYMP